MDLHQTEASTANARAHASAALQQLPQNAPLHVAGLRNRTQATIRRAWRNILLYYAAWAIIGLAASMASGEQGLIIVPICLLTASLLLVNGLVRQLLGLHPSFGADDNLRALSLDNHWQFTGQKEQQQEHFTPSITGIGANQKISQAFHGDWFNHPFESYLVTADLPMQHSEGRYAVRVFKVSFHKDAILPHVVVNVHRTAEQQEQSVLPRFYEQSQRVQLESQFENHFTVYSPAGTRTDALSFLGPNVLQTIIATNKAFDIELVGNSLYLYTRDVAVTPEAIAATFTILATLTRHITHRLQSWKFVLPNDSYPYLKSQAGYGTTTVGTKRFNYKYLIIAGIYALVMFRIWANPSWDQTEQLIMTVLLSVIMLIGVGVTEWQSRRRRT